MERQRKKVTNEEAITEVEGHIHRDKSIGRDRCKARGKEGKGRCIESRREKARRVKSGRGLERVREGAMRKRGIETEEENQSQRQSQRGRGKERLRSSSSGNEGLQRPREAVR